MMNKKKWIITAVVLIVLLVGAGLLYNNLQKKAATPNIGSGEDGYAVNFTVEDAEGTSVSLSDFEGKPIVLNFWASWCGYCVMEMPIFEEAYQKYGEDVVFMMINLTDGSSETYETARAFLEGTEYTFPVYYDTSLEAANAYEIYVMPDTIFINPEGAVTAYIKGALTQEQFDAELAKCMEGK